MNKTQNDAQRGLGMIRRAIRELLGGYPNGLTNYQVAQQLGIEVSFGGSHKNYLTYSVLQLMVQEGEVASKKVGRNRLYAIDAP
jgi:hypothetical protein